MGINAFEIVNVVIVILLLAAFTRKRDAAALFIALFVYGTLHFGFSAVALVADESEMLLVAMHSKGGGLLAKLSAIVLLGVVFLLLVREAHGAVKFHGSRDKVVLFNIVLAMMAMLLGYVLNVRSGDWLQLKNVVSLEAMLAFLMVGYAASNDVHSIDPAKLYPWWLVGGLCVLGFADCIAIYEVFYRQSWAGTMQSSGDMVYRASSLLFNPNLLGYWASLIYIGCAYGVHGKDHRRMMLVGMVLASVAIYFSGSRSTGYLLLAVMFMPLLLLRRHSHWLPLIVLPAVTLTLYVGATLVAEFFANNRDGWREISLLGLRFYAAVPSLLAYLMGKFDVLRSLFHFSEAPGEIVESIEGRFVGEGRDSGWLVLFQDLGWIGVASAFFSTCALLIWGMRVCAARSTATSAYALAVLVYCLLSGVVMRFQVFPVWLFTGVVLVHCLVYWREIPLVPLFKRK